MHAAARTFWPGVPSRASSMRGGTPPERAIASATVSSKARLTRVPALNSFCIGVPSCSSASSGARPPPFQMASALSSLRDRNESAPDALCF